MDNNPFRNHQSTANAYSSPLGGQQQQGQFQYQQQQQYQQPQQPQYQPQTMGYQQSYGSGGNMGNNNGYSAAVQTSYQPSTMGTTTTSMGMGALSPTQQQAQWQQQSSAIQFPQSNTDLFSNTQYNSNNLMSPGGYPPQQNFSTMSTPYGQQQQGYGQNQYMQQQDTSNFYIPPNFGMNTTTTVQQGPKHPPVDASSLLKGTQVRRVECPVCNKMIEGDDMAINHHVNQHL